MRMWMVNPKRMCKQHLLGEHVELHMLVGSLRRGRSIDGFLAKRLLEPSSLRSRHAALVAEMRRRGYRHRSPLPRVYVARRYQMARVPRRTSERELISRCLDCRERGRAR